MKISRPINESVCSGELLYWRSKPTVPGWYWHRIVGKTYKDISRFREDDILYYDEVPRMFDMEYYGPIFEPI